MFENLRLVVIIYWILIFHNSLYKWIVECAFPSFSSNINNTLIFNDFCKFPLLILIDRKIHKQYLANNVTLGHKLEKSVTASTNHNGHINLIHLKLIW